VLCPLSTSPPLHLSTSSPLHLSTSPPLHLSTSPPLHLSTSTTPNTPFSLTGSTNTAAINNPDDEEREPGASHKANGRSHGSPVAAPAAAAVAPGTTAAGAALQPPATRERRLSGSTDYSSDETTETESSSSDDSSDDEDDSDNDNRRIFKGARDSDFRRDSTTSEPSTPQDSRRAIPLRSALRRMGSEPAIPMSARGPPKSILKVGGRSSSFGRSAPPDSGFKKPQSSVRFADETEDEEEEVSEANRQKRFLAGLEDRFPPHARLADKYKLTAITLGAGAEGDVRVGIDLKTKEEVAVKVIRKTPALLNDTEFFEEVKILANIKHPNIIELLDAFETDQSLYVVFEMANGGDLFKWITENPKRVFPEKFVRKIAVCLLDSINEMHSRNIIHRDIKPENILFKTSNPLSLKISDFGFARHLGNTTFMKASAKKGTMGYAAPEILFRSEYDEKCDIWSLGVILYIMLAGVPPFVNLDGVHPKDAWSKPFWQHSQEQPLHPESKLSFPPAYWGGVSELAKHFIQECLHMDPRQRASAQILLRHKWLKARSRQTATSSFSNMQLPTAQRGVAAQTLRV
jgi:calcium/calmodulin-dependent protein kinase I